MKPPRVALVAIPLMARSGVYRTAHDLVRAATEHGLEWSAVLGLRPDAPGAPVKTPGVREFTFATHGTSGLREIAAAIDSSTEVRDADVVVTLISQSDIAMRTTQARRDRVWVAWVRGKPWPARGEQAVHRRVFLRALEARALRQADEVWATTPVLASEFASVRRAEIVPAGIAPVRRISWGGSAADPVVWAGRVDVDKRPGLFLDLVRQLGHRGRLFGDGPLADELREREVDVEWAGWRSAESLWDGASVFVGTSAREAFGRSAVEAASAGLPVVLGADYGAAPLLITNPELRRLCIIDSPDPGVWAGAVSRLLTDESLRRRVSDHVAANARTLTIDASVVMASQRAGTLSGRLYAA